MIDALRRILWLLLIIPYCGLRLALTFVDLFVLLGVWIATGSPYSRFGDWLWDMDMSIFGLRP